MHAMVALCMACLLCMAWLHGARHGCPASTFAWLAMAVLHGSMLPPMRWCACQGAWMHACAGMLICWALCMAAERNCACSATPASLLQAFESEQEGCGGG